MKQTAVEYLEDVMTQCLGVDRMRLLFNEFQKAKAMEVEYQHEYKWNNCKKIIHEGFVYVKYNDLLECEKSFKNCT
jgi:hypothetical protein